MCGITGTLCLGNQTIETSYIKDMCDVLAHRGPDDAGYFLASGKKKLSFTDEKFKHLHSKLPSIDSKYGINALQTHSWQVFLGHRRLSIIDPTSAGHQPMSDLKKEVWISYNGEIYNFKEIRTELIRLGYEFRTGTDTEVIISAYLHWGIAAIHKFNGMFAFALWDSARNLFYLVRDRYGIKPLYYSLLTENQLVFASEIKSILQYKKHKSNLDHEALLEYFTFQNIFTDKTLHDSIKLLPAGHYLEIKLNSKNPGLHPKQYWDFCFAEETRIADEQEYIEEFERLFSQAVTRQLVSDVEIGSYLSGGIDSGSVSAVAASHFTGLKTFTVGFDLNNISGLELTYDERAKSEYLSYLYKTEHYEMVLKPWDIERCMSKLVWHLEEPRVGQSYPNFYAAKLAGKFVKVVLSGVGSDELFGGYPWRYYYPTINQDFEDYINKAYLYWHRLMDNADLKKLFAPTWDKVSHVLTRDIFCNVFKTSMPKHGTSEEYINQSLYFEAKTFLQGLLLVEDKLSMAHSLEARIPFLDNDLVNFAMSLPVKFKLANIKGKQSINQNIEKTQDGKLILRKGLAKYMPEQYTKGVKQGFSSPDHSWFKGDSIEFIRKKIFHKDARIYQYFDPQAVEEFINQHFRGEKNKRLLIWSLLNFEYWCQQYA